jgi:hypothetical protein
MPKVYGYPLHFSTGYPGSLPEKWHLREAKEKFAVGIAPGGQEYFLAVKTAYPKRKDDSGKVFMDTQTGVINF